MDRKKALDNLRVSLGKNMKFRKLESGLHVIVAQSGRRRKAQAAGDNGGAAEEENDRGEENDGKNDEE